MSWGGVPLNARTASMMDEAQALYGATITATQGSPSTGVSASAGTHNGEGVIDVSGADLDAIVIAMRQVGFAAWHRTTAQGFAPHVHGVAVGEPLLSSAAAQQVSSYFAGYNGLASNGADDGPRTWVGVTWETYTGGTPLPIGDRPDGAPFWGESLPLDDTDVLSGAPTWFHASTGTITTTSSAGFAATKIDTGSGNDSDDYLTCTTGDSVLFIISSTGTYLAGGELPEFQWMIRARGTGTLAVFDDISPTWAYGLPTNSLGDVNVSSVDWADYPVPTSTPNVASILDGDGQRIAVQVTGSVEIVRVCLALIPVGGVVGAFGNGGGPSNVDRVPPVANHTVQGFGFPGGGATWADTWSAAAADLIDPVDPIPVTEFQGIMQAGYAATTAPSWELRVGLGSIDVKPYDSGPLTITGTEGVDFIRRPDRTEYDDDRLFRWDGTPVIDHWDNNVVSYSTNPNDLPPSEFFVDQIALYSGTGPAPIFGGATLVTNDASTDDVYSLGLAAADESFTLVFYSNYAEESPGPQPLVGTTFLGQHTIYLGDTNSSIDPDDWLPLTAVLGLPAYDLWRPGLYSDGRPDDPDGPVTVVTWLRQRQRNDGLGNSVIRAKSASSRQGSLRQRGYR